MGYNDYGAFVHRDGERMETHEDADPTLLDGGGGGMAIYAHLTDPGHGMLCHAVLGDKDWRVGVYKTSLPYLWHYADGEWRMADLLSYATIPLPFDCESERYERMTGDRVTRPMDYFAWAYALPHDGLECVTPGGTIILSGGHDHARWHRETIHVTLIEPDGTRWEAEVGQGYGAGFEDDMEWRRRSVRRCDAWRRMVGDKGAHRLSPCPDCRVRPAVEDSKRLERVRILCPKCGLRVCFDYGPVDYGAHPYPKGRELEWAAWVRANRRPFAMAAWNRLANGEDDCADYLGFDGMTLAVMRAGR